MKSYKTSAAKRKCDTKKNKKPNTINQSLSCRRFHNNALLISFNSFLIQYIWKRQKCHINIVLYGEKLCNYFSSFITNNTLYFITCLFVIFILYLHILIFHTLIGFHIFRQNGHFGRIFVIHFISQYLSIKTIKIGEFCYLYSTSTVFLVWFLVILICFFYSPFSYCMQMMHLNYS